MSLTTVMAGFRLGYCLFSLLSTLASMREVSSRDGNGMPEAQLMRRCVTNYCSLRHDRLIWDKTPTVFAVFGQIEGRLRCAIGTGGEAHFV